MEEILIFMTKTELRAFDLNEQKAISCKGDLFFKYANKNDIKEFDKIIKDEYNLESYSDMPMNFFVISLNSKKENFFELTSFLKDANNISTISGEYILPIICSLKQRLKNNSNYKIEIFEENYSLNCDNKGKLVITSSSENAKNKIELNEIDFFNYFNLSVNSLGVDEELIAKKDQELKEKNIEVEKLKTENKQLDIQMQDLDSKFKKEIESLTSLIKDLESKYSIEDIEKKIEEFSKKIFVCKAERKLSLQEIKSLEDDKIIKKGDHIFKYRYGEKASISGKIFSISLFYGNFKDTFNMSVETGIKGIAKCFNSHTLRQENYQSKKGDPIAIIVPEDWTKKEAFTNYFNLEIFNYLKYLYTRTQNVNAIKDEINASKDVNELLKLTKKLNKLIEL